MLRNVTFTDPGADAGWDRRLQDLPEAGFFHSSAWALTLRDAYGYRPIYAVAQDAGSMIGCIPLVLIDSAVTGRRAVGLPFSDWCEPLTRNDRTFHELWDWVIERGRESGWKYVELRGGAGHLGNQQAYQIFDGHVLNLTRPQEDLHRNLRPAVRRNLKRAAAERVKVQRSAALSDLRQFYCLNCLTRQRHGLPPQPWRFFRALQQRVLTPGHGDLFLARCRGEVIAGAVYLHFGGKVLYKYGASDHRRQVKRGNDAVMWRAICHYQEQGFSSLDFGRTGRDNPGLRRYKEGWGAAAKTLRSYRWRLDQGRYVKGQSNEFHAYNRVLNRLPLFVLRLIGEVLYEHVG